MSDHDPCCPSTGMAMPFGYVPVMPCQCGFISYIRADEREHTAFLHEALLRNQLADLRAKVEALQAQPFAQVGASGWDSISRADVLALFDGGSE